MSPKLARACAFLASLAVGLLLAYLFLRGWWQRLLFTALSIALPIVGNGLRAAGVVLAAHRGGPSSAVSVDHLTYGYVFTGLLLACLVGLAALFGARGAPLWLVRNSPPCRSRPTEQEGGSR